MTDLAASGLVPFALAWAAFCIVAGALVTDILIKQNTSGRDGNR